MSTDLYRVRVTSLDLGKRTVGFRVFLVYYDWSGVPTDASFFMRILWDEADTRFGKGGPLGNEVSVDQFLDEAFIDANTHRFVERVTQTALRNDPPPAMPPTFVYDSHKAEDGLTQGDYTVVVTDPKWMKHLKVGQTWSTTSYATRAVMPKGRETIVAKATPNAKNKAKAAPKKVKAAPKKANAPTKKTRATPAKAKKPEVKRKRKR